MIQIQVVQKDLQRILKAIDKVVAQCRIEADSFPRILSIKYAATVAENIYNQKFRGTWLEPILKPRYREWKRKKGHDSRIWLMRGDLVHVIRNHRIRKGGYFSGILRGASNTIGREIAKYAVAHEYGIGVPKRPVFIPTMDAFKHKQVVQEFKRTKKHIKQKWS